MRQQTVKCPFVALLVLVAVSVAILPARQARGQTDASFHECAAQLGSPPLSEIDTGRGRRLEPLVSADEAVLFHGLTCSRDQIVEYFEADGWRLRRVADYEYERAIGTSQIDQQYTFCYPRPWWKVPFRGPCSDLLMVNLLEGTIVAVGSFGAK